MIVNITNITDGPGRSPAQVDIYNKTLAPGASMKIPADLVTNKLRALEEQGTIAIGRLPPWYVTAKSRRGRELSPEEKAQRVVSPPAPPPTQEKKVVAISRPDIKTEVKVVDSVLLEDALEEPDKKRNKR